MVSPAPKKTHKNSDSILYRSRIEIGRILQSLSRENISVFADIGEFGDEQLFVSHILGVNADMGNFTVAYSHEKTVNSLVMKSPGIRMYANQSGARLSFPALCPANSLVAGQPAIKFEIPRAVLHYHREYKRMMVPKEVSLQCLIKNNNATAPMELRVVDISQDGMGCILYKGRGAFPKGTILRNCRIIQQNGEAIAADLIVRYTTPTILPDGTMANRTGVRFIQRPDEIEELIGQFVQRIDDTEI